MKARIASLGMLFALAGTTLNVASASPRPPQSLATQSCASNTPTASLTSYSGQIQSVLSPSSFKMLKGSTAVTVTYTSAVAVCEGGKAVPTSMLTPGANVTVSGHLSVSGNSYQMGAQKIVIAGGLQVANAGSVPAASINPQGPPPAQMPAPPSQTSGTLASSGTYTPSAAIQPANVATVNTAALQTANASNSTQSQNSQPGMSFSQISTVTGTRSTGNSANGSMGTDPALKCSSFSLKSSGNSTASGTSTRTAASSSPTIACGVPLGNSLIQYISAQASNKAFSTVTLSLSNSQIKITLSNARITGIDISSQGSQGTMNLLFQCQAVEIDDGTGHKVGVSSWSQTTMTTNN